jgi:aminoglycoside 6-adenylyltransferase
VSRLLESIVKWAQAQAPVRVLILEGARGAGVADAHSDYDVTVFCETDASYTQSDGWLEQIAPVWVCVHETLVEGRASYPTRLVIFEGGVKADFCFYPLQLLGDLVKGQRLPERYNRGYKVLVDKDGLAARLPKAVGQEGVKQPSPEEFVRVCNEFWFEVQHVAVALARDDLWSVQRRLRNVQDFLLNLLEWHARRHVPPGGKRMRSWVDEATWAELSGVFAHFDRADSRRALMANVALFRRLANETGSLLGYRYPQELDQKIVGFLAQLS